MKIGYPCINLSLPCRSSRTFRLASWTEERFIATVQSNLACLLQILEFNSGHNLLLFRITSDLIPFASHSVCTVPWQRYFGKEFSAIGRFVRKNGIRLSMHPDQFTLINSLDESIFERSVRELAYHADVLDLFDGDRTQKIQIHVGGVYDDKEKSMSRFVARFRKLPRNIKKRLVIENDERSYGVADCLAIHAQTGIPVVLDTLHHQIRNEGESVRAAFLMSGATWKRQDGVPLIDYSTQNKKKRPGSHAETIDPGEFGSFLAEMRGLDFDVMFEIKDKETSALKAAAILKNFRRRNSAGRYNNS
jgi:UV DNA damage endonuclease